MSLHRSFLADIRSLAVIAPHPDDEALGCGGLIALARSIALPVIVIYVSDGSGSHPGSRQYPPPVLARLRKSEARAAAAVLGMLPGTCHFLGLPDRAVPASPTDTRFQTAVRKMAALLKTAEADTVLVSHRDEPHCDHQASYALAKAATGRLAERLRLLEYRVWLETPKPTTTAGRITLDISPVLHRKRAAIACHRSQTTALITDDAAGFRLSPADLARFDVPEEVFEETIP